MNLNTSIPKKYRHLNMQERCKIEIYYNDGLSISEIARRLSKHKSTISREISRNSVIQRHTHLKEEVWYFADADQIYYEKSRKYTGSKIKAELCSDSILWIENKISQDHWSPDAAIGAYKKLFPNKPCITTKTFYNYIDLGIVNIKPIDLHLKVKLKPHSKRVKKHKKVLGDSIDTMPDIINSREEIGHWEIDTVVGQRKKSSVLMTLTERVTRMEIMIKIPSKSSQAVQEALEHIKEQYGDSFPKVFKSITCDNGSEFSFNQDFKSVINIPLYYAHPYSSYERGTNENHNGMIRRFIPKGKSIDDISTDFINRICNWMNTLPRKILNYNTPLDEFSKFIAS